MDFYSTLEPRLGKELAEALRSSRKLPVVHGLYRNENKLSEEALFAAFPSLKKHPLVPNAYYYEEGQYEPGKHLYHHLGGYYLMDTASMLPPYLLAPKEGERILDLCAAPGGKTCLMALMAPSSTILSNDLSYPRSLITSQNVERLGLDNVVVTAGDFAKAKDHYQAYFDAILLDAPCSGSAMFRKDVRLEEDWTQAKRDKLCVIQKELLELASTLLAPHGRIVYSTCSFSYEEDEAIVLNFLSSHPDFRAVKPWCCSLLYSHPDLLEGLRALPDRFPGEGQFACLLVRDGEGDSPAKAKPAKLDAESQRILAQYGLSHWDGLRVKDDVYALPRPMQVNGLSLLRYGVKVGSVEKGRFLPDHHLAVAGHMKKVPLSLPQTLSFLQGEGFPLDADDGEVSLTYDRFALGYAKIVKGYAKNHYPKGLRRKFEGT